MSLKKRLEKIWFSLLLTTLICIGVSRVFRQENEVFRRVRSPDETTKLAHNLKQEENLKSTESTPRKSVTRSLSQLKEETESMKLDENVLFFNRIPKTGSEMFVLLLQWLQGVNRFRHVRLPGGQKRKLDRHEQSLLAKTLQNEVKSENIPMSFDRHVYFTNFTEFGAPTPVYFTVVRDPVEKAVSRYYYGRVTPNPLNPDIKFARSTSTAKPHKTSSFEKCIEIGDPECSFFSGQPYDLSVPYFCGHYSQCMILNDRWALARAKQNIEEYFPVVGVLEEMNATLSALEEKLPKFFKGVTDMYYHELLEPHRNRNRRKPKVSPKIRHSLKKKLTAEYELYYWLKSRLIRQLYNTSDVIYIYTR